MFHMLYKYLWTCEIECMYSIKWCVQYPVCSIHILASLLISHLCVNVNIVDIIYQWHKLTICIYPGIARPPIPDNRSCVHPAVHERCIYNVSLPWTGLLITFHHSCVYLGGILLLVEVGIGKMLLLPRCLASCWSYVLQRVMNCRHCLQWLLHLIWI